MSTGIILPCKMINKSKLKTAPTSHVFQLLLRCNLSLSLSLLVLVTRESQPKGGRHYVAAAKVAARACCGAADPREKGDPDCLLRTPPFAGDVGINSLTLPLTANGR